MFPDINPGTTNNTAGWTCGICGVYVSPGFTHYCAGQQPSTYPPYTVGGTDVSHDAEIMEKLDEIIGLLKRLLK